MAPLVTTLPVELSAADRARVDAALRDSRAGNTRAQYRSAWRGWSEWAALAGHQALPADPLTVAAYLAERVDQGAAAATVRTIRAAIRAGHVDTGADDPTGHAGVRRVLQGLTRQAAGRGRGQAAALRQLRELTVQRSGLRPDGTAQVLGGINGQSIARRLRRAAPGQFDGKADTSGVAGDPPLDAGGAGRCRGRPPGALPYGK